MRPIKLFAAVLVIVILVLVGVYALMPSEVTPDTYQPTVSLAQISILLTGIMAVTFMVVLLVVRGESDLDNSPTQKVGYGVYGLEYYEKKTRRRG